MSLSGQIEEMGLGAVIQTLSLNSYMGTLRIETEDAGSQFFFISEGAIVLVRQVTRDPVRLGDLLIRAGKITQDDLMAALTAQKETKLRLGEQLVADGLVEQDQIERVIQGKFEEEFLDLFLLDKGRFEFIFGLTPEALFAPDEKLERVSLNTSGLMLEAMRRVDEWQDMINSLGSLDTIFTNHGRPLAETALESEIKGTALLGGARKKLYALLDGDLSMREILGQAISQRIASRLETFLFLHYLCETQTVQPLDPKTLLTHARGALSAKDVPKAAKFIRAILGRKGQLEIGLIKRYLEFLRKNSRPKLAFDEARMFAGQALARGESKQAIALYEEAVALEYRNPEVIDRLFYTLLRENLRDRAIEVGLMLRDYLSADTDLQVATRVVRNLKELDPENPEVLELSGQVLRRKEQNEEAVSELERALERATTEHPRRSSIVGALLDLQPEREDLRAELESIEVREAREAVQREFRRRMVLVSAIPAVIMFVLIGGWRGYQELSAKGYLAQARELQESGPGEHYANYSEASRLLTYAQLNTWFYASEALDLQREIDGEIAAYNAKRQREMDAAIRVQQAELDASEREERRRLMQAQLGASLAEYKLYVSRRDWVRASVLATEIRAKYRAEDDPRVGGLAVYLELHTDPPGATVFHGEEELGVAPLAVALLPGQESLLEARLSGYRPLQRNVAIEGHQELTFTLQTGPSWELDLPEAPLPLAVHPRALLVATPAGDVRALDHGDGSILWEAKVERSPLSWVELLGDRLIVGGQASAAALDAGTGQVQWTAQLSGEGPPRAVACPLASAERPLASAERLLVARGTTLTLLDGGSGETRAQLELGAAAESLRFGEQLAFVLTSEGRVEAIHVTADGLSPAWSSEPLGTAGDLRYSSLAQALLVQSGSVVISLDALGGSRTHLAPEVGELFGIGVVEDRLYVVTADGSFVGLRVPDGRLLVPATNVAQAISSPPLALGSGVFLTDGAGNLIRLDRDGRRVGGLVPLGGVVTAPLLATSVGLVAVTGRTVLMIQPRD